jgi:hypothetical protein
MAFRTNAPMMAVQMESSDEEDEEQPQQLQPQQQQQKQRHQLQQLQLQQKQELERRQQRAGQPVAHEKKMEGKGGQRAKEQEGERRVKEQAERTNYSRLVELQRKLQNCEAMLAKEQARTKATAAERDRLDKMREAACAANAPYVHAAKRFAKEKAAYIGQAKLGMAPFLGQAMQAQADLKTLRERFSKQTVELLKLKSSALMNKLQYSPSEGQEDEEEEEEEIRRCGRRRSLSVGSRRECEAGSLNFSNKTSYAISSLVGGQGRQKHRDAVTELVSAVRKHVGQDNDNPPTTSTEQQKQQGDTTNSELNGEFEKLRAILDDYGPVRSQAVGIMAQLQEQEYRIDRTSLQEQRLIENVGQNLVAAGLSSEGGASASALEAPPAATAEPAAKKQSTIRQFEERGGGGPGVGKLSVDEQVSKMQVQGLKKQLETMNRENEELKQKLAIAMERERSFAAQELNDRPRSWVSSWREVYDLDEASPFQLDSPVIQNVLDFWQPVAGEGTSAKGRREYTFNWLQHVAGNADVGAAEFPPSLKCEKLSDEVSPAGH